MGENYEQIVAEIKQQVLKIAIAITMEAKNKEFAEVKSRCMILKAKWPYKAEPMYWLGTSYMMVQKIDEALVEFQNAIKVDPKYGEAYIGLGSVFLNKGQYKDALDSFTKAEMYGYGKQARPKICYYMGLLYEQSNNIDSAIQHYEQSLNDEGCEIDVRKDVIYRMVRIYLMLQNIGKAEYYATQLKLLVPDAFPAYLILLKIRIKNKNFDGAEKLLKEAEERFANKPEYLPELYMEYVSLNCAKAEVYLSDSKTYYDEALEYIGKMSKMGNIGNSLKEKVRASLLEIYRKTNDIEKLSILVEKMRENQENYDDNELSVLIAYQTDMYVMQQRYNEALDGAKRLKESSNSEVKNYGYYREAFCTMKLAEKDPDLKEKAIELYRIAIAYYRNCLIQNPTDFNAMIYRIKAHADLGNHEKAKELFQLLPELPGKEKEALKQYLMSSQGEGDEG